MRKIDEVLWFQISLPTYIDIPYREWGLAYHRIFGHHIMFADII